MILATLTLFATMQNYKTNSPLSHEIMYLANFEQGKIVGL